MIEELFLNGYKVDLSDAVPFPMSFSIADIKNPEKAKRNRTKTVDLPGTQNNLTLFSSTYLLTLADPEPEQETQTSIITFDPTIRVQAQYYHGGLLLFDGLCKLNRVVLEKGSYKFNITLFSNVIDIFKGLGNLKLNELPGWSVYNHRLNFLNIRKSWEEYVVMNADENGDGGTNTPNFAGTPTTNFPNGLPLGFGYVYGVADYGFKYGGNFVPQNKFTSSDLIPLFYLRELALKSFKQAAPDLTIDCELFDTPNFRRMVMGGVFGEKAQIEPEELALRAVDVDTTLLKSVNFTFSGLTSLSNGWAATYNGATGDGFMLNESLPVVDTDIIYDGYNQINNGQIIIKKKGKYKVSYAGNFTAALNIQSQPFPNNVTWTPMPGIPFIMQGALKVYRNGSEVVSLKTEVTAGIGSAAFGQLPEPLLMDLNAGDVISFKYQFTAPFVTLRTFSNTPHLPESVNLSITTNNSILNFQIEALDSPLQDNEVFDIARFVPDMKCSDFLKGLMLAFNLYMDEPEDGVLKIRTMRRYYNEDGNFEDWTDKVDYSKPFEIIPASTIEGREYLFKFKDAEDSENRKYLARNGVGYGNRIYDVPSTFESGQRVFELPFAQSVPVKLRTNAFGDETNIIAPRIIEGDVNLGTAKPIKSTPRVYFYNGVQPLPGDEKFRIALIDESVGGTTFLDWDGYACINHQNDLTEPTFDWNYAQPFDFWEGWQQSTNNNLWSYIGAHVHDMTARSSAIIRCAATLTSSDIYQNNFGRLKMIDGVLYRLNEIKDWDNTQYRSTQIELLKAINSGDIFGNILEEL